MLSKNRDLYQWQRAIIRQDLFRSHGLSVVNRSDDTVEPPERDWSRLSFELREKIRIDEMRFQGILDEFQRLFQGLKLDVSEEEKYILRVLYVVLEALWKIKLENMETKVMLYDLMDSMQRQRRLLRQKQAELSLLHQQYALQGSK